MRGSPRRQSSPFSQGSVVETPPRSKPPPHLAISPADLNGSDKSSERMILNIRAYFCVSLNAAIHPFNNSRGVYRKVRARGRGMTKGVNDRPVIVIPRATCRLNMKIRRGTHRTSRVHKRHLNN